MSIWRHKITWSELGRGLCRFAILLLLARFGFRYFYPVDNTIARLWLLGGGAGLVLGALILIWPRQRLRWASLFSCVLLGFLTLVPVGPPVQPQHLRAHFVERLVKHEGKPFVWGAENGRAVDCSGLVRLAMREALGTELRATGNPRLLHLWVKSWCLDRAARDFLAPWHGLTTPVAEASTTPGLDARSLLPGDVAVTAYGYHIMAYLGDQRWIQADPERGRVVVDTSPAAENWYKFPVHALRLKWE